MPNLRNFLAVKQLALKNHVEDTWDREIELAYRHYSKTYHTALHTSYDLLTPQEVLLLYFEDQYIESKLTVEEANDMLNELNPTAQPVIPSLKPAGALTDDEWIAQQERLLKAKEKPKHDLKDLEKAITNLNNAIGKKTPNLSDLQDGQVENLSFEDDI